MQPERSGTFENLNACMQAIFKIQKYSKKSFWKKKIHLRKLKLTPAFLFQ